jgi:hypothetical protein
MGATSTELCNLLAGSSLGAIYAGALADEHRRRHGSHFRLIGSGIERASLRDLSRPDPANEMGLLGYRPATPSTVDPKTPAAAIRAARPGPLIVRVSRGDASKNSRRFKQSPAFVFVRALFGHRQGSL